MIGKCKKEFDWNSVPNSHVGFLNKGPITQILCEINFGELKSLKTSILTQLETLNFDFYDFLLTFNK